MQTLRFPMFLKVFFRETLPQTFLAGYVLEQSTGDIQVNSCNFFRFNPTLLDATSLALGGVTLKDGLSQVSSPIQCKS